MRLKELVSFARSHAGEDRAVLFRNLVDLFVKGKAPIKTPARAPIIEVVRALIPHVDPDVRRAVADLLSDTPDPPIDLVLALCQDRANIVASLLQRAPFDEDDLIALIEDTGREHHQIISSRADLSANVWIALARATSNKPPHGPSTVALWKESLTGSDRPDTAGDIPSPGGAPVSADAASPGASIETAVGAGDDDNVTAIASVRPGGRPMRDTRSPAKLRILRLDGDIESDDHDTDISAPEGPDGRPARTIHHAPSVSESQSAAPADPLTDPGPGGWAWRSNRDGFVANVSPATPSILGKSVGRLVGEPMLDMLGLNTKLGHPIARALQRRSTIHDAPLYLPKLGKEHRYWTLDATPVFHAKSGVFEGYEGQLMPVRADTAPRESDDDDSLFLPDRPERTAGVSDSGPKRAQDGPGTEAETPDSQAENAAAAAPERPASLADSLRLPEDSPASDAPSYKAGPASQVRTAGPEAPHGDDRSGRDILDSFVSDSTADLVRSVIAEAFNRPADEADAPETAGPDQSTVCEPSSPEDAPSQPRVTERARLDANSPQATLSLLHQALDHLIEEGRSEGNMTVRLQAEIARACVRVLEDHLRPEGPD